MASTPDRIRIRYRRLPDRENIYRQELVHRGDDSLVTLLRRTRLKRPIAVGGDTVLERGSPVVWFTFPGRWYDVGRFHRADGTFTGFYANILTPVRFVDALMWETTDLFLDVWARPGGPVHVLDRDEFDNALEHGWIDAGTAASARAALDDILDMHAAGQWPPQVVREWELERVLDHMHSR